MALCRLAEGQIQLPDNISPIPHVVSGYLDKGRVRILDDPPGASLEFRRHDHVWAHRDRAAINNELAFLDDDRHQEDEVLHVLCARKTLAFGRLGRPAFNHCGIRLRDSIAGDMRDLYQIP